MGRAAPPLTGPAVPVPAALEYASSASSGNVTGQLPGLVVGEIAPQHLPYPAHRLAGEGGNAGLLQLAALHFGAQVEQQQPVALPAALPCLVLPGEGNRGAALALGWADGDGFGARGRIRRRGGPE